MFRLTFAGICCILFSRYCGDQQRFREVYHVRTIDPLRAARAAGPACGARCLARSESAADRRDSVLVSGTGARFPASPAHARGREAVRFDTRDGGEPARHGAPVHSAGEDV